MRSATTWLEAPVGDRGRVRRSTALMFVSFLGLGALLVHTRSEEEVDGDRSPPVVVASTTSVGAMPSGG